MHFNPVLAFAAIATTVSALPTTLSTRDAGPSGSVISPAGDTHYAPGSAIHFQYQAVSTDVAQTTSVAVQFITFDGRVTRNDNNFTVSSLYMVSFPCTHARVPRTRWRRSSPSPTVAT